MGRGKNRGRRKRKEQMEEAKRDLSDEELDAALAEIASGSDRVAAIMGGALVQNTLIGALITHFEDRTDIPRLFDTVKGPLNTFYGQIVMGKALGLFDEATVESLHAIRSVRNEFAHAAVSLTFENAEIAKKCGKLTQYEDKKGDEASTPRRCYEHACYELACHLMAAGTENIKRQAEHYRREALALMAKSRKNHLGTSLADLLLLIPPGFESGDKDA
jgi:hypothetical protein